MSTDLYCSAPAQADVGALEREPSDWGVLGRALLDSLNAPTVVIDGRGWIVATNRRWDEQARRAGADPAAVGVGMNYLAVLERDPADSDALAAADQLQALLDGDVSVIERDYECSGPAGVEWYSMRVTPLDMEGGGAVITHVPITRHKLAEQGSLYLANYDQLTGLPNRRLLLDRLEHTLRRSQRSGSSVGVLFVDVDRFKVVNDTYGHRVGDVLLRRVAARLQEVMRPGDTLGRLSGDEFVGLIEAVADDDALEQLAQRLNEVMRAPFVIDGRSLAISVSVGIARARPGTSAEVVLDRADRALYRVKRSGRDSYAMASVVPGPPDSAQAG